MTIRPKSVDGALIWSENKFRAVLYCTTVYITVIRSSRSRKIYWLKKIVWKNKNKIVTIKLSNFSILMRFSNNTININIFKSCCVIIFISLVVQTFYMKISCNASDFYRFLVKFNGALNCTFEVAQPKLFGWSSQKLY